MLAELEERGIWNIWGNLAWINKAFLSQLLPLGIKVPH